MIRISPIRLIDENNEQVGLVETHEALRRAQEAGMDLVEVVADARPPVCKIMDYGKYKYDLSKKEQQSRASSKQTELKEIRLGRSIKIDPHDVQIRVDQSRRFLMAGHKVQLTQRFRGREMAHKQLGLERLAQICEDLGDIAKVEMAPRWMGRQASILLAPDKVRIEHLKRKLEEKGKAHKEEDLAKLEAEVVKQNLAEEAEDQADEGVDAKTGVGTKRGSGPADQRATNPVDDEMNELLGG